MKKTALYVVLICLIIAMLNTGCTTPQTSTDPAYDTQASTETPATEGDSVTTPVDNPALERGNVLAVSTTLLEGKFNPILADSLYDDWIVSLVFEGLISNDAQGNAIPAAAERWDISDDKTEYTFHLADGMTFHDGTPVTAQDVAFTYYTMADPSYDGPRSYAISDIVGASAYQKGQSATIEGIKVIDDQTIMFKMTSPNVQKIWDFAYGIMPEHIYKYEDWASFKSKMSMPVGSGIMRFDNYTADEGVSLSAFDDYYKGRASIDGINVLVQTSDEAIKALAAGEIDMVNPPANIDNYDAMLTSGITTVQEFTGNGYNFIGFNLRNSKLSDKRVRQALAYGLNRELFLENQWEGFASICNVPISPVSWAYPDPKSIESYAYNPDKARALLDAAGWVDTDGDGIREKDGEKLSLTWTGYNDVDWSINLITMAKANWKDIGVELNADLMAFTDVSTKVFDQQDFELWNMGWTLAIDPDPTGVFDKASDVLGGYNAGGYYNERAEVIFKEGSQTYNQEKRAELYKEWALIANDDLPYLFNAYRNDIWGINNRVRNVVLGPYYDWTYAVKDMTLDYH